MEPEEETNSTISYSTMSFQPSAVKAEDKTLSEPQRAGLEQRTPL